MTDDTKLKELKTLIDGILSTKFNMIHSRVDTAINNVITQMEEIKDLNELSSYEIPAEAAAKFAQAEAPPQDDNVLIIHKYIKNISSSANQLSLINNFLEGINHFSSRAALFLLREDKLVGWKGRGFSAHGGIDDEEVKKIFFSLSAGTIFKQVLKKKEAYSGPPTSQPDDHLIYSRLGGSVPEKIFVLPFFVKGKPQAVVYTDSIEGKPIGEKEIEMISTVGEMSLDLLPLRQKILAKVKTQEFVEEPEEKPQVETPQPEEKPKADVSTPTTTSMQSISNEQTVPSIRENDPERLARVIINDIILYNKAMVEDGRKHQNLYKILEDTIMQAKELYLNKFSDLSSFEKQLIETLATGNKEALKGYRFETL